MSWKIVSLVLSALLIWSAVYNKQREDAAQPETLEKLSRGLINQNNGIAVSEIWHLKARGFDCLLVSNTTVQGAMLASAITCK